MRHAHGVLVVTALAAFAQYARAQDMNMESLLGLETRWAADNVEEKPRQWPAGSGVVLADGTTLRSTPDRRGLVAGKGSDAAKPLDVGVAAPAGVAAWPDGGTVVVGDASSKYLWTFRVEPNGSLSCKDRYYQLRTRKGQESCGTVALACDQFGRGYAATELGVQAFDPTGRLIGVIPYPPAVPASAVSGLAVGTGQLTVYAGGEKYSRPIRPVEPVKK